MTVHKPVTARHTFGMEDYDWLNQAMFVQHHWLSMRFAHVGCYSKSTRNLSLACPPRKKSKTQHSVIISRGENGMLCRNLHVSGTKINKLGLTSCMFGLLYFFALSATQRESKDPNKHFLTTCCAHNSETLLFATSVLVVLFLKQQQTLFHHGTSTPATNQPIIQAVIN